MTFILDLIHQLELEADAQTPEINLPLVISVLYNLRNQTLEMRERLDKIYDHCRDMDRGVGYRVSGDHSTWDSHTEGKSDFAGEVLEILNYAEQYEVDRHAEKQGCSYSDAWSYFEDLGYDMSRVTEQYT